MRDDTPAFPVANEYYPNDQIQYGSNGMTLRQWYAGMALQGMVSNPEYQGNFAEMAESAFRFADAMVKRGKE